MSIPTPGTVTADWLTERLRDTGYPDVEVRGYQSHRIGTGQLGQCIRYELDLVGGDGSAPRRVIGKFPSDDPASRHTGVMLRNYRKEVCFYSELQSRVPTASSSRASASARRAATTPPSTATAPSTCCSSKTWHPRCKATS
jgi:hypothetical protein